ncbi:dTDP-4-amino-4,6-dideoxygalactose transaminase [archaeon]|nr:dTDP-4-amino-4,6-dideoxygalactose transaminase [archaeon]|tara:strand:- start:1126 stop:2355 length:1230 start_codon:yes stop_codon:yes gene_type:complete
MKVPFNKETLFGGEDSAILLALSQGQTHGDGPYTKKCHQFFETKYGEGVKKALLTTSCTMAFEMAFILSEIGSGDEVIMPSFGYPSAASSLMVHGAIPVFVDIDPETLSINENLIEAAITDKTKAIFVVHYAGVSCDMDKIMEIASRYGLKVIEDAAQAIGSKYKGKLLGIIGDFGCISFHGTKNIVCGEGGVLLVNREQDFHRSEIIWEKGTDRKQFLRGEVDKYSWVDLGSSYLPSELQAAFLSVQLENIEVATNLRKKIWTKYHTVFSLMASKWEVELPIIPHYNESNFHLYSLLFESRDRAISFANYMKEQEISAYFHFVPLHESQKGKSLGYTKDGFEVSSKVGNCLIRLPLYNSMTAEEQEYVIQKVVAFFEEKEKIGERGERGEKIKKQEQFEIRSNHEINS